MSKKTDEALARAAKALHAALLEGTARGRARALEHLRTIMRVGAKDPKLRAGVADLAAMLGKIDAVTRPRPRRKGRLDS